jgi:hypothetical protein
MKSINRLAVVAIAGLAFTAPAASAMAAPPAGHGDASSARTVAATTAADRPVSRFAALDGLPSDWVSHGSACFYTADPQDHLCYEVRHGATNPAVVDFRLEGARACLWAKTLVMPDGEGNQWDIDIDPSRGVFANQNGLWAHQVRNGQHLSFWKAGFLGFKYKVLEVGDLGDLVGGDVVVFRWLRDSGSCHD